MAESRRRLPTLVDEMKLLMLQGIPGSGKSSWAKDFISKNPGWKIVNKDSLRAMLDNGKWSGRNEKFICQAESALIGVALVHGYNVIIDSTNFNPRHEDRFRLIASSHEAEFEIKFFEIDVEEAIKRDLKRPNPVGEAVIRKMYRQYVCPIVPLEQDSSLPHAICFDLDGTLCKMVGRSPYDWDRVGEDLLVPHIDNLLKRYAGTHKILLVSGRDSVCRKTTMDWLDRFNIHYDGLFMRPEGDSRKDSIIKREIFDNEIRNKYFVEFAVDDRDQVVRELREIGIPVFQIAEGTF
ncbi:MAG: AAA family ATPase [Saprospiraceae bacterium]